MPWRKLLACATGRIESVLLRKLEFVLEENRVYRSLLERHAPHWQLNDRERRALAEKGRPLGKLLAEVITLVQPATLLKWHQQLIARKWTFPHRGQHPGRPRTPPEIESLVIQFARENPAWGYDRIVGALANLGHAISDQTVANLLHQHGLGPSGERRRHLPWAEFIRRHQEILWATDFLTTEVWTRAGLTTFCILFFIQVHTRRIVLGGVTRTPTGEWMKQVARNVTGEDGGIQGVGYLLHDRDTKFTEAFDDLFAGVGIQPLKLPPRSPNLNAFAERWVRSVKDECLDQLILFGERSLRHALAEYLVHYHHERNHQGLDNLIPLPDARAAPRTGRIITAERLGGLLKYYHREAA